MNSSRAHASQRGERTSGSSVALWGWRVVLVLVLSLLLMRGTVLRVADYYVELAADGDLTAQQRALDWNPSDAVALRIDARRKLPELDGTASASSVNASVEGFKSAIAASPFEVRAMARLLTTVALSDATFARASSLADLVDRLAPVMPQVQQQLVTWSLMQDDYAQAVIHMARAMVGQPSLREAYFPVLMSLASDEQARTVLMEIARDPRRYSWWNSFFRYVANEAEDLNALRGLVALRSESADWPLQPAESGFYLSRLRREGLVTEAYLHWVNNLSSEQMLRLGYLYDGGFNLPFDNTPGFGWQANISPKTGVVISRSETFGSSDDASLRVSLGGKRVRFRHVSQDLALPEGRYRVRGRVRPDQLDGRKGMQWALYCTVGGNEQLGTSEAWLGTGEWRDFWFDVVVPDTCTGQRIRLESVGNREVDHELIGTIWFDDLRIELGP